MEGIYLLGVIVGLAIVFAAMLMNVGRRWRNK